MEFGLMIFSPIDIVMGRSVIRGLSFVHDAGVHGGNGVGGGSDVSWLQKARAPFENTATAKTLAKRRAAKGGRAPFRIANARMSSLRPVSIGSTGTHYLAE
uniref:Uncharacterized protein n=1 Tax=Vespula pensylvanica TaxID=30213 RepID=A0A834P867_VESPE|nr:hypothetical protein H0235_004796 [Vespula pensylvanica]